MKNTHCSFIWNVGKRRKRNYYQTLWLHHHQRLMLMTTVLVLLLNFTKNIRTEENPCKGLILCRLKPDVAQRLGLTEKPPVFTKTRYSTLTSSPLNRDNKDTKPKISSPKETKNSIQALFTKSNQNESPIVAANSRKNSCHGLRLCKLKPTFEDEAIDESPVMITTPRPRNRLEILKNRHIIRNGNESKVNTATTTSSQSTSSNVLRSRFQNRFHNIRTVTTSSPESESFIDKKKGVSNIADGQELIRLVLVGDLEDAAQLIQDGADVNSHDVYGNSVLHIAAQNGRTEIVEDLLLNGAEVNKGNNHRNSALHLAAQNGWTELSKILLKHRKIEVDFRDLHANTPLHLAAQNGQIGVTKNLLSAEAALDIPNAHKQVPLHLAVQNGHLELSKMLTDAGANLDASDLYGNTPLHTAYHTSHMEIARMLESKGADVKKANLNGLRPPQLVRG